MTVSDKLEEQVINDLIARACVLALIHDLDDMTLHIEGALDHSSINITVEVRRSNDDD